MFSAYASVALGYDVVGVAGGDLPLSFFDYFLSFCLLRLLPCSSSFCLSFCRSYISSRGDPERLTGRQNPGTNNFPFVCDVPSLHLFLFSLCLLFLIALI